MKEVGSVVELKKRRERRRVRGKYVESTWNGEGKGAAREGH